MSTYSSGHEDTKVLDHTLTIEEVVRCNQEVPTESSKPWQVM